MVTLDGVGVDRYSKDKVFLCGVIRDIIETDELCVTFMYPGLGVHENISSTTSELQYMYFKGSSGDYDLAANGRYIPYLKDNRHTIHVNDVIGDCEHISTRRAFCELWVTMPELPELPDIFQYQLIFNQAEFDDAYRRRLLDDEYAKYSVVGGWLISPSDPDCFDVIRPDAPAGDGISREGWLCQAVEFGPSGCWPLPWWACPHETEKTIYFRGECSCDHFKDTLQPLGIPCYHLIKAKKWYGSTVPYCPYIKCP